MISNSKVSIHWNNTHLCLSLMSPPCGRPDMMTLTWQEWIKLVHSHPWYIKRCDMHMRSRCHSGLCYIGCAGATVGNENTFFSIRLFIGKWRAKSIMTVIWSVRVFSQISSLNWKSHKNTWRRLIVVLNVKY